MSFQPGILKGFRALAQSPTLSHVSSLPPSSNGPGQQPLHSVRPNSARKRGGQSGHLKQPRPLIPTEACDRVVHHRPGPLTDCGSRFSGSDPGPTRHPWMPSGQLSARNLLPNSFRKTDPAVNDYLHLKSEPAAARTPADWPETLSPDHGYRSCSPAAFAAVPAGGRGNDTADT